MSDTPTKFEADLKAYFPEIWELHQLGKSEANLWELITVIQSMRAEDITGRVIVSYTKGHIDRIMQDIDVLAYKGKRPGFKRGDNERGGGL